MLKSFQSLSFTTTLAVWIVLTAVPSSAAAISYADAATWTAATSNQTSIQFTGIAPSGSFTDYGSASGLVLSGVTFLGYISPTAYQLAVVDQLYANQTYSFGGGASLLGPNNNRATTSSFLPYIQVNLPANVIGFATDLMSATPSALPFTVTLSSGETFTVATQPSPSTTFFGITADSPIAYVDFALPTSGISGNTYALLKDFQFTTAAAQPTGPDTPEAATLILIGTGLVLFRYMKKKGLALDHMRT